MLGQALPLPRECTDCQRLGNAYVEVANEIYADPQLVEESTQANEVCGEKGTIRRALHERGEIKPHKVRLNRHTDRGSDNVATTMHHFFPWLLVYCGEFVEALWFRFKAGHSLTEICDRLFSITKAIFESGSCTRVADVEDFPHLIESIREEFKDEKETSQTSSITASRTGTSSAGWLTRSS
ncbi:MAG: hypothetical protein SGPRY_008128, partial [Prymnesium sp.]